MESDRCIAIVREELKNLEVAYNYVEFKKVTGMTPFDFRHFGEKSWRNTVNV